MAQKNRQKILNRARRLLLRGVVLLASFSILAIAGYGGWNWLCASEIFRIVSVDVSGCKRLNKEDVVELAGISPEQSLVDIDTEVVKQRLEASSWIRHAEVFRSFPDHLVLKIMERDPVALVNSGEFYLMDKDGVIFKKYKGVEKLSLPIVTGFKVVGGAGSHFTIEPESAWKGVRAALEIIHLASRGIRVFGLNNISQIDVSDNKVVVYTVDGGVPFRFGTEDIKKQFVRAEKILYNLYTVKI
jgi:cell division protein FtsQ